MKKKYNIILGMVIFSLALTIIVQSGIFMGDAMDRNVNLSAKAIAGATESGLDLILQPRTVEGEFFECYDDRTTGFIIVCSTEGLDELDIQLEDFLEVVKDNLDRNNTVIEFGIGNVTFTERTRPRSEPVHPCDTNDTTGFICG